VIDLIGLRQVAVGVGPKKPGQSREVPGKALFSSLNHLKASEFHFFLVTCSKRKTIYIPFCFIGEPLAVRTLALANLHCLLSYFGALAYTVTENGICAVSAGKTVNLSARDLMDQGV
jgi:hypothetical protein